MATFDRITTQTGMIRTQIDISDAMEDFSQGVANKTVLLGATTKVSKRIIKPRMSQIYGGASGGPKRITGALSKKSAIQVKGLWYKDSKVGVAIVGHKTKNISEHTLPNRKGEPHAMEKWHANQIASGNKDKYRVSPGITVNRPGAGDTSLLGNKPWKISSTVQYDSKIVRKKVQRVIKVTRNPSRIAHLIEFGHRFPAGGNAKAYKVVDKTYKQTSNATQSALTKEIGSRATKAANRAAQKASARVAQRAGIEL